MSWSVSKTGSKQDLRAAVEQANASGHMPEHHREVLLRSIDSADGGDESRHSLSAYGHMDAQGAGQNITITLSATVD